MQNDLTNQSILIFALLDRYWKSTQTFIASSMVQAPLSLRAILIRWFSFFLAVAIAGSEVIKTIKTNNQVFFVSRKLPSTQLTFFGSCENDDLRQMQNGWKCFRCIWVAPACNSKRQLFVRTSGAGGQGVTVLAKLSLALVVIVRLLFSSVWIFFSATWPKSAGVKYDVQAYANPRKSCIDRERVPDVTLEGWLGIFLNFLTLLTLSRTICHNRMPPSGSTQQQQQQQ